MAQISGVEVQSITGMYGAEVTSIVSISGVDTANIPGWPTGFTCTTVYYGFAPSREGTAPEEACIAEQLPYEWDDANQVLFNEGSCGQEFARKGYYSDGTTIYSWDPFEGWSEYGSCTPPANGPTNLIAPTIPSTIYAINTTMGTSGSWTGTGTLSYTYNWFSDNSLVYTSVSPEYNDKTGKYINVQPSYNPSYNDMFTNLQLQVTASDSIGTTVTTSNIVRVQDLDLEIFLTNSGITGSITISALEGLQKGLKSSSIHQYLFDYYPFAGTTVNEQKWSLKNPNEYLRFNNGWTFSSEGAQANSTVNNNQGTFASSSYSYINNFGLTDIGIYNGANVVEDSFDIVSYYETNTAPFVYAPVRLSLKTNGFNGGTTPNTLSILSNSNQYTASINSPLGLIGIAGGGGNGGANSYTYTAFQSRGSNLPAAVVSQWNSVYTNTNPYQSQKIRIGSGASSPQNTHLPGNKLYQFAYAGYYLGEAPSGLPQEIYKILGPIIQNYQSALGRGVY